MDLLWVLVLLTGLAGLSLLAWSVRALDAAGAIGAFVIGLVVVLVGGVGWLVLMSLFTVIGVAATWLGRRRKLQHGTAEARGGERGLRNVVANGMAPMLAALAALLADAPAGHLAFAAAVAAVTADTLASEIGGLSARARCILPPFDERRPGSNGAVSGLGQFAAFLGAGAIALFAAPLLGIAFGLVWIAWLAGFAGCQLDSVLGATLERDELGEGILSKEDVNFIASVTPAFLVFVLVAVF